MSRSLVIFLMGAFVALHADAAPRVITVNDAVAMAVKADPELRAVMDQRAVLSSSLTAARTHAFPTVTATSSYTHNGKLPITTFAGRSVAIGAEDQMDVTGRVDQTIYSGGRITTEVDIARLERNGGSLRLKSKENEIVARAREACFEVIRANALHKAAVTTLLSSQAHRKDAEARVRAGVAAGVEVIRADVRVQEAALDEASKRNRRDLSLSRLANYLGLPTTEQLALADGFPDTDLQKPLDDPERHAIASRPDLRAARLGAEADEGRVTVARSGYFPSLAAFGSVSYQDDETRSGDETWKLGLSGSWEIFNWGRTANQVDAARSKASATRHTVRDMEDEVRLQVREASLQMATARESLKLAEARVKAAEEDLRISRLRFNEGVGIGTEVIDAESDLAQSNAAVINARADYAVAQNRFWFVTGG